LSSRGAGTLAGPETLLDTHRRWPGDATATPVNAFRNTSMTGLDQG
jgi:hypothetical protein